MGAGTGRDVVVGGRPAAAGPVGAGRRVPPARARPVVGPRWVGAVRSAVDDAPAHLVPAPARQTASVGSGAGRDALPLGCAVPSPQGIAASRSKPSKNTKNLTPSVSNRAPGRRSVLDCPSSIVVDRCACAPDPGGLTREDARGAGIGGGIGRPIRRTGEIGRVGRHPRAPLSTRSTARTTSSVLSTRTAMSRGAAYRRRSTARYANVPLSRKLIVCCFREPSRIVQRTTA